MSPQVYFEAFDRGQCLFNHQEMILTTVDDVNLKFPYEPNSMLPFLFMDPGRPEAGIPGDLKVTLASAVFMQEIKSILQHGNHNLATWEKEYLLWHQFSLMPTVSGCNP